MTKKKKLIYLLIIILIVVIFIIWGEYKAMHRMPEINNINIYGNSSENLNNRGLIAKQGQWLYMRYPWNINFFGPDSIYRISLDGKEKHHVIFDEPNQISVYDEWIYYCPVRLSPAPYYLYRVRLDGSKKSAIISDIVFSYMIYNNQIFYTTNSNNDRKSSEVDLRWCDINGKNKRTLLSGIIKSFTISSDRIFYSVKKNYEYELVSCDFNGQNKISIYKGKYMINIAYDDGWIYYILKDNEILYEGTIYKMNDKGEEITELYKGDIWNFNKLDDWVIVKKDNVLYRISSVTKKVEKIIDGYEIDSFYVQEKHIYFYSSEKSNRFRPRTFIYRVDINGNDLTRFN